jgi:E3 ubiquitin-protein ligase SHPRH
LQEAASDPMCWCVRSAEFKSIAEDPSCCPQFDEANELIDLLNEQTVLLWKWRTKLSVLLIQKLSAGQGEADGEEYSRTLETQGEAETYLQAYTALMADRREVLVAERTLLAAHDVREKKLRHTKAAIRAAQTAKIVIGGKDEMDMVEDIELQPEHEVLKKELTDERKHLLQLFQGRAVKSVMVDLSAVQAKIVKEDDSEKIIARSGAQRLRKLIASQSMYLCSKGGGSRSE